MCATQVHVEVEDRTTGIAVIDRVRPWVPLLLAISAGSPFWQGRDSGFASWRSQVWNMWPSAGPKELFGDTATYDTLTRKLIDCGAILDVGLLNLDVRLSAAHPTVEFRVADACASLHDTLVVEALCRALTETAVRDAHLGTSPPPWRVDELRAAAWRAGRSGLSGTLVSPHDHALVPSSVAVHALLEHTATALDDAGDLEFVALAVDRMGESGSGACRQRRAFAPRQSLLDVVAHLRTATLEPPC